VRLVVTLGISSIVLFLLAIPASALSPCDVYGHKSEECGWFKQVLKERNAQIKDIEKRTGKKLRSVPATRRQKLLPSETQKLGGSSCNEPISFLSDTQSEVTGKWINFLLCLHNQQLIEIEVLKREVSKLQNEVK
jgi:hypothetical protein